MEPANILMGNENTEKEITACRAQAQLLESFISIARSPAEKNKLNKTLQKTLDIAIELNGAEKGSIFLLDENGVVKESILTRSNNSAERQARLVGTVLDRGLAGWVQHHRKAAHVNDTEKDDRWLKLPNQPYEARSALAVPIMRQDRMLGLLTLLHSQPAQFNPGTVELCCMTADQIAVILDNANLYTKLDMAKQKIENYSRTLDLEMEKGRKLQKDFLPDKLPVLNGWEMAADLHSALRVSGDFYDAFTLSDRYLMFVIGDVCDKGVGAALFMALFRSLIRAYVGMSFPSDTSPAADNLRPMEILEAINSTENYIATLHGHSGMFATLVCGVLNHSNGELTYINAGHEPPIVIGSRGIKHVLMPTGPAVGISSGSKYTRKKVQLERGDTLIGYTDGVTEAESEKGIRFTRDRLHDIVAEPPPSAIEMLQRIESALFKHIKNAPRGDDITILTLRRKPVD